MKGTPPPPPPPLGSSGLPNLGTLQGEETSTRRTETGFGGPPASVRPARPTLTVLTGFDAGRLVSITHDMIIGRAADSQLVLSDPGVSRAHARLSVHGDEIVVHDMGAKNGTFVESVTVGPDGRVVRPHEVIHIGPHVSVRFALMTKAEEKLASDLYESSMRDPLTRAFNRRYLANRLTAEVAYVKRHGGVLSLLTFDFDHFKKLNDQYGHASGDAVLRMGSAVVLATLRSEDILARIGGEEFVVVLRGIGRASANACAERIRSAVERTDFGQTGNAVQATISIGASTSDELTMDPAGTALIQLADKRLYEAKSTGRNRVVGPPAGL